MRRKLAILIASAIILILLSQITVFSVLREFLETRIVLPLRGVTLETEPPSQSLRILSLTEAISQLKQENQVLREQLGAIPEKANLMPAKVIWQDENQMILSFPYSSNQSIIGQPVVWGEIYLGRVSRVGANLLVIDKPVSSGFVAKAITGGGIEGRLKGQFNQQVVFETAINNPLDSDDRIYYLEPEQGWRFLLGTVAEISRNKRLPTKQGIINYLPAKSQLSTVFVVI